MNKLLIENIAPPRADATGGAGAVWVVCNGIHKGHVMLVSLKLESPKYPFQPCVSRGVQNNRRYRTARHEDVSKEFFRDRQVLLECGVRAVGHSQWL